jgi:hypothetical protein
MMDKELLHEKLSALLDNELAGDERTALEALIDADPEVAREWEELNRVDGLFRNLPKHEAPKELGAGLRTEETTRPLSFGRPRSTRRAPWPLLVAAVALVLVFGLVVFQLPDSRMFNMAKEESALPSESGALDSARPNEVPAAVELEQQYGDAAVGRRRAVAREVPQKSTAESMAAPSKDEAGAREPQEAPASDAGAVAGVGGSAFQPDTDLAGAEEHADAEPRPAPALTPPSPTIPAPPPVAAKRAPAEGAPLAETERDMPMPSDENDVVKRIGDRVFEKRENAWVQNTYDKQQTAALARDSGKVTAIITGEPALRDILALAQEIVFEFDGVWYRIPEVKESAPIPAETQP